MTFIRAVICDGCGAQADMAKRDGAPAGWRRLHATWVNGRGVSQTRVLHACQPMCAARALDLTYDGERLRVVRGLPEVPRSAR